MNQIHQAQLTSFQQAELLVNELADLRETVHSLKLKDAINRSTVEKLKRDRQVLLDEEKKIISEQKRLQKARNQDSNYLARQEEYMAELKISMRLGEGGLSQELANVNEKLEKENEELKKKSQRLAGIKKNMVNALYQQKKAAVTINEFEQGERRDQEQAKCEKQIKSLCKLSSSEHGHHRFHLNNGGQDRNARSGNQEDAKEFYNPEIKRAKELTSEIKQKTEIVKRERVEDQRAIHSISKKLNHFKEEQRFKGKKVPQADPLQFDYEGDKHLSIKKLARLKQKMGEQEQG